MIDDSRADTRRRHESAVRETLQISAVGIRTLGLLAAPVRCGRAGAVEDTVEVGGDDSAVFVERAVEDGSFLGEDAGVGDEDVEAGVEVVDGGVDGGGDLLGGGYVDAVGFALDAVFCFDLGGPGRSGGAAVVPNGDVGACFGQGMGDGEADSGATTGDDGGFSFAEEER